MEAATQDKKPKLTFRVHQKPHRKLFKALLIKVQNYPSGPFY